MRVSFYTKFILLLLFISSYYLADYLLFADFKTKTYIYEEEIKQLGRFQKELWSSINFLREYLYNPDKPLEDEDAFLTTKE